MRVPDDSTFPELLAEAAPRIASRMRFEDPARFVEFFDKQLSKHIVGLPHPEALPVETELLVIVSPPGAPDALQMRGVVTHVQPRSDDSVRLRVEVTPSLEDMRWLDAYVVGLRTAVDWHQQMLEPVLTPPPKLGPTDEEVIQLASRLDSISYYDLLQIEPGAPFSVIQEAFHELTRRYHPDLFLASGDDALGAAVNRVYRRMNEAYAALKSPRRRRAYDSGLDGPAHRRALRFTGDAAERVRRQEQVVGAETGPGDHYWTRARALLDADPFDGSRPTAIAEAIKLLRVAVSFEPDNEHFAKLLGEHDRPATPAPGPKPKRKPQNRKK